MHQAHKNSGISSTLVHHGSSHSRQSYSFNCGPNSWCSSPAPAMYHVHPSHRRCTSSGRKSQPAVAEYAAGWVAMSLSNCGVSWSKLGALWSKKRWSGNRGSTRYVVLKLWVCCLKIGNLAGHESSIMLSAFHFSWYPQFPASPKTPWWRPTNKIWASAPCAQSGSLAPDCAPQTRSGEAMVWGWQWSAEGRI